MTFWLCLWAVVETCVIDAHASRGAELLTSAVWHTVSTTYCGSVRVISPQGHPHAEATDAEKSHVVHACVHTCGCRVFRVVLRSGKVIYVKARTHGYVNVSIRKWRNRSLAFWHKMCFICRCELGLLDPGADLPPGTHAQPAALWCRRSCENLQVLTVHNLYILRKYIENQRIWSYFLLDLFRSPLQEFMKVHFLSFCLICF